MQRITVKITRPAGIGIKLVRPDLTVLVANNQLYSLTTGQTSPTAPTIALVNAINHEASAIHVSWTKSMEVIEAIVKAVGKLGVTYSKQLHS